MIAQADLAREAGRGALREEEVAHVLERISERTADARVDSDIGFRA